MKYFLILLLFLNFIACSGKKNEESNITKDWLSVSNSLESQGQLIREVPATYKMKEIVYDKSFKLVIGVGSNLYGLSVIEFSGENTADIYTMPPNSKHSTIELTNEEVNELVSIMKEGKIGEMSNVYSSNIMDGSQWVFYLKSNTEERHIYFDNYFPNVAVKLVKFSNNILNKKKPIELEISHEEWAKINKKTWDYIKE